MVNVGMDIGYGDVKVVSGRGERKFPSAVVPYTERYSFEFGNGNVIEVNGDKYLIGAEESLETRTRDYHKRSYFKALFLYSIKDVPVVNVVMGLPIAMARKEERKALEEELKGEHVFKINGEERSVKVSEVKVIAQGMGALLDYLIEEDRVKEERKDESVIIFDVGYFTTDVFVYKRGRIDEGRTISFEVGVSHLLESVRDYLKVELSYPDVSLKEVEKFFMRGYVKVKGKKVELKKEVFLEEWKKKFEDLIKLYEKEIYVFDTLIVAGGGAYYLDADFFGREVYVPQKPEFANARGYYKFARVRWG